MTLNGVIALILLFFHRIRYLCWSIFSAWERCQRCDKREKYNQGYLATIKTVVLSIKSHFAWRKTA